MAKIEWLLGFAYAEFGDEPIGQISAPAVRGLRSTIGSVFSYAIATARAENDPTYALRVALTQVRATSRPTITDAKNLAPCVAPSTRSTGSPAHGSRCNCSRFCFPAPANCGWLNGPSSTRTSGVVDPRGSDEDAAAAPDAVTSPDSRIARRAAFDLQRQIPVRWGSFAIPPDL